MKKYILPENVNWYRANFHCHTVKSDGAYTPEKVKKVYKKRGYSIVAYSDHEILLDHSYLNDESFLALTSCEYSITESTPSFPQIFDVNTGNWPRAKCVHLNIFAKDQHNTFQPYTSDEQFRQLKDRYNGIFKGDGKFREFSKDGINAIIKACNDAGFLVQLNHPYWSLNEREDYINMEGLWGLEILNYATELETGSEYCPYIYDDMVRNGMFNLVCTMGDDNHNHCGDRESFGGSTIIGAKELTYEAVIDAMEKGNIYCTSGRDNPPMFNALYVEDNIIKIDCTPAVSIYVNGYGRNDRHITAPEGEEITHAEFPLREGDVYFRITVRDKYGNNAHTHTYFVKDFFEKAEEAK
ncbi:MAG: hypothetical protein J6B29_01230 [Clostridia bacterium]|nr:hypothetical protein [Clostridia bacterium]